MKKANILIFLIALGCVASACSIKSAESNDKSNKTASPEASKKAEAPVANNNVESAEALIRRVYADHPPLGDKSIIPNDASQASQKTLAKYFDEELTRLIIEDIKCSRRTGEVCNLDFDPIYATQDMGDSKDINLKIREIKSEPTSSSYEVTFSLFKGVTTKLIYQMKLTDQGWRVSDIIIENSSLKDTLRTPQGH